MTNNLNLEIENAKQKLGEQTQKFERKAFDLWNEYSPSYTSIEPWKRGMILIGLLMLLALALYYLTHESEDKKAQRKLKAELALEERMLRRMETLKKLRE